MKPQLTNEEKSLLLANKARNVALEGVARDWTAAEEKMRESCKIQLSAANLMRNAGIKLQEAAGREQIDFEWFKFNESKLPKGMNFKAVSVCVRLARNFDQPIQRLDEARSVVLQMMFAFDQLTEPHRATQQNAHELNPWDELVSWSANFNGLWKQIGAEAMEAWDHARLRSFVSSTEPIVEKHQAARALLGKDKPEWNQ